MTPDDPTPPPTAEAKPPVHRVYVRWPQQRVSNRTRTENAEVAAFAYHQLVKRADLVKKGAIGVAWTFDGVQQAYHDFQVPLASIANARRRLDSEKRGDGT
jgi:hypothetical protein